MPWLSVHLRLSLELETNASNEQLDTLVRLTEVFMDDLVLREDGSVEYRWTFTGTSAETGKSVRVPGYEEWTIAPDGLIAESRGHYDQAEYDRQLQHGLGPAI